jgi:uncharacterized protein (DUF1778 family)
MASASPRRRERLEARVTREQKELFEEAAALEGTSLTDFVVRSTQRAAEEVIREHSTMVLSTPESRSFVDALLQPPAPNRALRAAAEHYKRVAVSR